MTALYPAGFDFEKLSKNALNLKVARHSRCSECDTCAGLHPAPGTALVLDSFLEGSSLGDLSQYGSDEEERHSRYLSICACGHDTRRHGADELRLGKGEYARRTRVAIRLDELLSDEGKLLDFDYTNEDIDSLRLQMQLPGHVSSPLSEGSPGKFLGAYLP